MRFRPAGTQGLLVEPADRADVARLYAELRRRALPGVVDLVPAATTLLITGPAAPGLADVIARWSLPEVASQAGPTVEIAVVYDGEDLDDVARLAGLSVREVVQRHSGATFVAAFCGFAPGFAYLEGLPPELHVARRDVPRTAVPAGAVAIAGPYAGVYPRASPGGWRLLGRTDAVLWDARRDPPALLAPGTRVRFVERAA